MSQWGGIEQHYTVNLSMKATTSYSINSKTSCKKFLSSNKTVIRLDLDYLDKIFLSKSYIT